MSMLVCLSSSNKNKSSLKTIPISNCTIDSRSLRVND